MDGRRTWQPPRPAGRGRADHTAIVGCGLFDDGVAVESPGPAADLARMYEQALASFLATAVDLLNHLFVVKSLAKGLALSARRRGMPMQLRGA